MTHYTLRPISPEDRSTVTPLLVREWGAVEVVALSFGAVDEARKVKPEIPSYGEDGIPIRDGIKLTKELQ